MYDYFSIKFTFLYYLHGDLVGPGVIVVAGIVGSCVVVVIGVQQNLLPQQPFVSLVPSQVSPSLMHEEPSGHVSVELKN